MWWPDSAKQPELRWLAIRLLNGCRLRVHPRWDDRSAKRAVAAPPTRQLTTKRRWSSRPHPVGQEGGHVAVGGVPLGLHGPAFGMGDRLGNVRQPGDFLQDGAILKHLPGLITVLRDGGYRDEEVFDWLFRDDDSLPGTPVQALRGDRHTEVTRRAQALAF